MRARFDSLLVTIVSSFSDKANEILLLNRNRANFVFSQKEKLSKILPFSDLIATALCCADSGQSYPRQTCSMMKRSSWFTILFTIHCKVHENDELFYNQIEEKKTINYARYKHYLDIETDFSVLHKKKTKMKKKQHQFKFIRLFLLTVQYQNHYGNNSTRKCSLKYSNSMEKKKTKITLSKQNYCCICRTSVTFVDIISTGKYQVHVNLMAPLLLHTIHAHH